eukprot:TRINITY_DN1299_c0_g1_i2.p1 TRINITY_DN1299_c0_g1~~TRINITY_DN1299_c0_g1_i2.p1  ORF type:complete len:274 (+),score=20.96 TRINITY_DN1299_c0_g1_i2:120-941(+)
MLAPIYFPRERTDIRGSHLIVACTSVGQSAVVAAELFLSNQSASAVGYLSPLATKAEVVVKGKGLEAFSSPLIVLPSEVFYSECHKATIVILRSDILEEQKEHFEKLMELFITSFCFVDVIVLGTTRASTSDLRESNSHIPEFYSTYNFAASSYAESVNENQRIFHLRKLYPSSSEKEDAESLYMAGQVPILIELLSRLSVPGYTLLIHAFDGLDLVGGWLMYSKFLDVMNVQSPEVIQKRLELVSLGEEKTLPVGKLYKDINYPELWETCMK